MPLLIRSYVVKIREHWPTIIIILCIVTYSYAFLMWFPQVTKSFLGVLKQEIRSSVHHGRRDHSCQEHQREASNYARLKAFVKEGCSSKS